jgi:hypothetical protein
MGPHGVVLVFSFLFFLKKNNGLFLCMQRNKDVFNEISLSCFQPDFDLPVTQTLMAKSHVILFL